MRKLALPIGLVGIALLVGCGFFWWPSTPASQIIISKAEPKILSFSEPPGLQVTISNIERINSANASATVEFTEENAHDFCLTKGDRSAVCVQNIQNRTSVTSKVGMNCDSGDFTDVFNSRSRLVKTNQPSRVEYSIVDSYGEKNITDYEPRLNLIKLLCPSLIQEPITSIVQRYFDSSPSEPADVSSDRPVADARHEVKNCNDQAIKNVLLDPIYRAKDSAVKQLEKDISEKNKILESPILDQKRASISALEQRKNDVSDAVKRWQIDNQIYFDKLDIQKAEGAIREIRTSINYMKNRADKLIDMILRVINVRQQSYDDAINVRYCSAEFAPLEDMAEFGKIALNINPFSIPFTNPFVGVCAGSFDYKIEAILDEPERNYVTSNCYRRLQ